MLVKKILLMSIAVLCTSTQAKWFPQVCKDRCTLIACKDDARQRQCEEMCKDTPKVLESCKTSITPPSLQTGEQPASLLKNGVMNKTSINSAPPRSLNTAPLSGTRDSAIGTEALFLEKVSNKLLEITNSNCNRLIGQTYKKINIIPPKPAGYTENYTSAKEYELKIKQISQSFIDLKGRVKKLVDRAKDPNNKEDIMKIFVDIQGDIDLNSRKNCEKYTNAMNDEMDAQLHKINAFNAKKPSVLQRIKKKLGGN